MRNVICELPDGHLVVTFWEPHPCGGIYMVDARVFGPNGFVGRWVSG
ncbi:MAG: hypothetical protein LC798_15440 [Chloroflexi bacterium]|nr:hypothetical protein [Chloroflexota bacterium]